MRIALQTPAPRLRPEPATHLRDNVLKDDYPVVDQQSKGDDDCGDGDLLERDAEDAHPDKREHHGERNDQGGDEAGPKPEEHDD